MVESPFPVEQLLNQRFVDYNRNGQRDCKRERTGNLMGDCFSWKVRRYTCKVSATLLPKHELSRDNKQIDMPIQTGENP